MSKLPWPHIPIRSEINPILFWRVDPTSIRTVDCGGARVARAAPLHVRIRDDDTGSVCGGSGVDVVPAAGGVESGRPEGVKSRQTIVIK